jgi:hypothetical protein
MPIKEQTGIRPIESIEDFCETRIEAIGFIFHGILQAAKSKGQPSGTSNLLHFARCAKLEKAGDGEAKIWFRTINIAKAHLDETVGNSRWKWCKVCEREITQKILNER